MVLLVNYRNYSEGKCGGKTDIKRIKKRAKRESVCKYKKIVGKLISGGRIRQQGTHL